MTKIAGHKAPANLHRALDAVLDRRSVRDGHAGLKNRGVLECHACGGTGRSATTGAKCQVCKGSASAATPGAGGLPLPVPVPGEPSGWGEGYRTEDARGKAKDRAGTRDGWIDKGRYEERKKGKYKWGDIDLKNGEYVARSSGAGYRTFTTLDEAKRYVERTAVWQEAPWYHDVSEAEAALQRGKTSKPPDFSTTQRAKDRVPQDCLDQGVLPV